MKLPCIKTRFFEKTVCLFVKRVRFGIDDFGILSLARLDPKRPNHAMALTPGRRTTQLLDD